MSDSSKRKLNANQIAADIRAGLSHNQLMQKYGLNDHQLWAAKAKLARLNLVPADKARPPREMAAAKPPATPPAPPESQWGPSPYSTLNDPAPAISRHPDAPARFQREWVCPSCGSRQARDYDECPVCGIVVAKYRSAYQQGPYVVARSRPAEHDTTADASTGWKAVAISIAIMVVLGVGLVKWASHRSGPKGVSGSASDETGFVKSVTVQSFERDVVAASREYPVLVEFYADT